MEENVEKEVVSSPGEEAEGMDVEDASEWMDVTDQVMFKPFILHISIFYEITRWKYKSIATS